MDPISIVLLVVVIVVLGLAAGASCDEPTNRLPFGREPMSDRMRQELVDAAANDL